jgi:hypothetical protein
MASTSRTPIPANGARRAAASPFATVLAILGVAVVVGIVWIAFVASTSRHPGRPAILNANSPDVVAGTAQAEPGRPSRR